MWTSLFLWTNVHQKWTVQSTFQWQYVLLFSGPAVIPPPPLYSTEKNSVDFETDLEHLLSMYCFKIAPEPNSKQGYQMFQSCSRAPLKLWTLPVWRITIFICLGFVQVRFWILWAHILSCIQGDLKLYNPQNSWIRCTQTVFYSVGSVSYTHLTLPTIYSV